VNPSELRDALASLAANHRWVWQHRLTSLFDGLPTAGHDRHPVVAVRELSDEQLAALASDTAFVEGVLAETASLRSEMATAITAPDVVYYSPEFGISDRVPQYSGGLGILAGDHLKAASDLGTSLGAVGLFYRQGFFRQELADGQQAEQYDTYTPDQFGLDDTGITVEVPLSGRNVVARVWKLQVGRITLLLLDADVPENDEHDRDITDRLYSGDPAHRLEQEMLLGVGGARAVQAYGWTPGVHHLNEGHAGFLTLELVDRELLAGAVDLPTAVAAVKPHVLFTTHTPVPAGIDRFPRPLIAPDLLRWADRWRLPVESVMALGTDPDAGTQVFNMAALALGMADRANGVSKLHGEVSRELFAAVPGGDRIGSVTNGVHARTWVSPALQDVFDAELGDGWDRGDVDAWKRVAEMSDETIATQRVATRQTLVDLLAERMGVAVHPDALVIGFARRFATYKRATLLLRHPEVLAALLADDERPIHVVFAGKAHPADTPGKSLLADVVAYGGSHAANGRFSFVTGYDIAVARALYSGADVWLNTPVRPHEASGTSGEKAALNGVVNCSILDGWWAEMSDGRNGFDIATSSATDPDERDDQESASALDAIGRIAAEFHADGTGTPSGAWIDRMRHNWITLGPLVTSARMVTDYDQQLYQPMLDALRA
jgi:starch phosphorylase